ncbi:MAG: DUF885 family protein [Planctomycetota bacterium]|nr:DUF885 family protein [Planctomycetota bacterium]
MQPSIEEFQADFEDLQEFYSLRWSNDRAERLRRFLVSEQSRIRSWNFQSLDQSQRIDAILLRNFIRERLSDIFLQQRRAAEMEHLLPFAGAVQELESARVALRTIPPRDAGQTLSVIAEQVEKARDLAREQASGRGGRPATASMSTPEPGGPRAGADGGASDAPTRQPPTPSVALRAAGAVEHLREVLRRWHSHRAAFEPEFAWWTSTPFARATKALGEYSTVLREDLAGIKGKPEDPLVGDPIGREALLESLRAEVVALSPEELVGIGQRELQWCQERMIEQARELGLGDDWRAALDRVKDAHVEPGEQDDVVVKAARESIDFLVKHDLLTIPPLTAELWRLEMLSAERQRSLPFAAYGGLHMLVAYPTDSMTHEDKLMSMRGNNPHFTRIVTAHELIPGHHHQLMAAKRHRPDRALFRTPFFVEGWALYWEMKLWDMNFAQTPEDRLGMLFWRAHRCARIVVSLKFHLGEMAPAEMIDYLVREVGHERANATSEVRRFVGPDYSPLYQCAYMIGGLQLRALHREAIARGWKEKDFNDQVLRYNSIPIELLRAEMLSLEISPEFESSWRFGEP